MAGADRQTAPRPRAGRGPAGKRVDCRREEAWHIDGASRLRGTNAARPPQA